MATMNKTSSGFTVIEIIFVIIILGFASVLFFMQKNDLQIIANDNHKKTAINAMHYALEEVFYENNKYYPQTIDAQTLKSIDPELLIDPSGMAIGEIGSEYSYSTTDCNDNKCNNYKLSAILSKESEYIKTNKK